MSQVVPWKAFIYKIREYFSTLEITRGLLISLLSSAFIYLEFYDYSYPLFNTFLGLLALYLLLDSNTKTWFITGAFTALFWFWWIARSLVHYELLYGVPLVILIIMLSYGLIFAFIAWLSHKVSKLFPKNEALLSLIFKSLGILTLSTIHPFSFDWFKPELMFIESYLGIEKWQFAITLSAMTLTIWRRHFLYLSFIMFAYQPSTYAPLKTDGDIALMTTSTSVKEKWNETLHPEQFQEVFKRIDHAIDTGKTLVVLPESVFPLFLNRSQKLIDTLEEKAKHISIVTGGLYWDGKTPRNSTYIFTNGKITVANKVILVPFGERNPLPDFLSDWINQIFYDGAVDYKASSSVVDYVIDGKTYRNAICFEATSEQLYSKDREGKRPENMIVLSNNGWFTPSTEPTLQKLLLKYYSKKYGTTIYHAINMSDSYMIQKGKVSDIKP
ncbi:MAG: apolipoprotein N-acyltransferase [Campylobacterota bacterium]|nr:apolipoprotein N-acyltransferase [Campylobacterota bacterium]